MVQPDFTISQRDISNEELEGIASELREDILVMIAEAKSGHTGGSLSVIDILTALYFARLRHDPSNPKWPQRDRLLLSKGHAAPALYAALSKCGYFPKDELKTLRKINSRLQGHPDPNKLPGVEIPGGPEGIGMSEGIGMALAARIDNNPIHVYVIIGDGELNEGEVWEAAMAAAKFKVENLTVILDKNGLQQEGRTQDIMPTDPIAEKFRSFGWSAIEIDGHDMSQIVSAIDQAKATQGAPTIIIANTIKGKGVDFMEHNVKYHGTAPTPSELPGAIDSVKKRRKHA